MPLTRKGVASARDAAALVSQWKDLGKPRKRGVVAPRGSEGEFHSLFESWLHVRGLSSTLVREGDQDGFLVYGLANTTSTQRHLRWERAWHGTWWYALWYPHPLWIGFESNRELAKAKAKAKASCDDQVRGPRPGESHTDQGTV